MNHRLLQMREELQERIVQEQRAALQQLQSGHIIKTGEVTAPIAE